MCYSIVFLVLHLLLMDLCLELCVVLGNVFYDEISTKVGPPVI